MFSYSNNPPKEKYKDSALERVNPFKFPQPVNEEVNIFGGPSRNLFVVPNEEKQPDEVKASKVKEENSYN